MDRTIIKKVSARQVFQAEVIQQWRLQLRLVVEKGYSAMCVGTFNRYS